MFDKRPFCPPDEFFVSKSILLICKVAVQSRSANVYKLISITADGDALTVFYEFFGTRAVNESDCKYKVALKIAIPKHHCSVVKVIENGVAVGEVKLPKKWRIPS
jgi:hypothetical protein